MIPIKTEKEIELMRESCRIVRDVLKLVGMQIRPGIATETLDALAEDFIHSCGAVPAFKGYGSDNSNPFPATLCISIDNEVVHGIPGRRVLKDGEIVSIDVGVKKNGFYGDGAFTFPVGAISETKKRLISATQAALLKGIAEAVEGNRIGDISFAVQSYIESQGFSIVRDLVGHGVGRSLHEEPQIPNYGKRHSGIKLKEGMVLAIEPMVNAGNFGVHILEDGWTVVTMDGEPSAHFEHTVIVQKERAEILTQE